MLRYERNLSASTLRIYGRNLCEFDQWLSKQALGWPQATHHDIVRFQHECLSNLNPITVRLRLSALAGFFRWAIRENLVAADPTLRITRPKTPPRSATFLSQAQVDALLAVPDTSSPTGLRNRAILELLYGAGLRRSEVLHIKMHHLYLKERAIIVEGKGRKERAVVFGQVCADVLARWIEMRSHVLHGKQPTEYLFFSVRDLNRGGKARPLAGNTVYTMVQEYASRAAVFIPLPLKPHCLRHTFATHLYQGGANLRAIQLLLGHSHIQTTAIYTHVLTPQLKEVINKMHPRNQDQDERWSRGDPPSRTSPFV